MLVLGLQGSPRLNGNTDFLLSAFLKEAQNAGAETERIDVSKERIEPCKGCVSCEKNGYCIIKDDVMTGRIYHRLKEADLIVAATPIFFYHTTSQLKGLIDRSQTLWSRKYKFHLKEPKAAARRGFLLALGATKGKNLFDGLNLTMKYFFDAVSADYQGMLSYRHVENPGDMKKVPTVTDDVKEAVKTLLSPFMNRKTVVFAGFEDACRTHMAAAFARHITEGRIEIFTGGIEPAVDINPMMVEVMEEKGLDAAYYKPQSIDRIMEKTEPDMIVTMGIKDDHPMIADDKRSTWSFPDRVDSSIDHLRQVRDEIEKRVVDLIDRFNL